MARLTGPAASPVLGKVFLSVGGALLAVAGIFAASRLAFLSSAGSADGLVVEIHRQNRAYVPVVAFTTDAGQTVRFEASIGSNPPAYHVGEAVRVRYDPERPEHAFVDSFWQLWFFSALFGILGTPFAVIGGGFRARARGPKSAPRA
jgi:Protein of unknown function (DUF3592)